MDARRFLDEFPRMWDGDPQHADWPRDRRFRELVDATRGMATENKLALLNLAANCLEPGEIYLEVGAWTGCSILGAALGNDGPFVTVDDFSQFGGALETFRNNMERFGRDDIELINDDAWRALSSTAFAGPVGVYFYDGGHTFDDQYRALEIAEPLLADEALVIIDDTAKPQVTGANAAYIRKRPQFEMVLRFHSPYNSEPRWWDGIEVFAYRRALGPGKAPTATRLRVARLRARAIRRARIVEDRTKHLTRQARRTAGKIRRRILAKRSA